jgi:hypothetical protein
MAVSENSCRNLFKQIFSSVIRQLDLVLSTYWLQEKIRRNCTVPTVQYVHKRLSGGIFMFKLAAIEHSEELW